MFRSHNLTLIEAVSSKVRQQVEGGGTRIFNSDLLLLVLVDCGTKLNGVNNEAHIKLGPIQSKLRRASFSCTVVPPG